MSVGNFAHWYFRQHFDYWPSEGIDDESEESLIFSEVFNMVYNAIDSDDCESIVRKEQILTKILSSFHSTETDLNG